MTTRIFIQNQTSLAFQLYDLDNNLFANIVGNGTYSLLVNYNNEFNKQYVLKTANGSLFFTLDTNGEIILVNSCSGVANLLMAHETKPSPQFLKNSGYNKLIIYIGAPAKFPNINISQFAPPVPPLTLILDFVH